MCVSQASIINSLSAKDFIATHKTTQIVLAHTHTLFSSPQIGYFMSPILLVRRNSLRCKLGKLVPDCSWQKCPMDTVFTPVSPCSVCVCVCVCVRVSVCAPVCVTACKMNQSLNQCCVCASQY